MKCGLSSFGQVAGCRARWRAQDVLISVRAEAVGLRPARPTHPPPIKGARHGAAYRLSLAKHACSMRLDDGEAVRRLPAQPPRRDGRAMLSPSRKILGLVGAAEAIGLGVRTPEKNITANGKDGPSDAHVIVISCDHDHHSTLALALLLLRHSVVTQPCRQSRATSARRGGVDLDRQRFLFLSRSRLARVLAAHSGPSVRSTLSPRLYWGARRLHPRPSPRLGVSSLVMLTCMRLSRHWAQPHLTSTSPSCASSIPVPSSAAAIGINGFQSPPFQPRRRRPSPRSCCRLQFWPWLFAPNVPIGLFALGLAIFITTPSRIPACGTQLTARCGGGDVERRLRWRLRVRSHGSRTAIQRWLLTVELAGILASGFSISIFTKKKKNKKPRSHVAERTRRTGAT